MICKIISYGESREDAIKKLIFGLLKVVYMGSITNKNYLISILKNEKFQKGEFNTHFISDNNNFISNNNNSNNSNNSFQNEENMIIKNNISIIPLIYDWYNNKNNFKNWKNVRTGFRNNKYKFLSKTYQFSKDSIFEIKYDIINNDKNQLYIYLIDDNDNNDNNNDNNENKKENKDEKKLKKIFIEFEFLEKNLILIEINNIKRKYFIMKQNKNYYIHSDIFGSYKCQKKNIFDNIMEKEGEVSNEIRSVMPGKILKLLVKDGDVVKKNQPILIVKKFIILKKRLNL
jgi:acetyl/propionyl-CoA carboxylase alpha subunit